MKELKNKYITNDSNVLPPKVKSKSPGRKNKNKALQERSEQFNDKTWQMQLNGING